MVLIRLVLKFFINSLPPKVSDGLAGNAVGVLAVHRHCIDHILLKILHKNNLHNGKGCVFLFKIAWDSCAPSALSVGVL